MLDYYRSAGERAAWALAERMSVDGLDRGYVLKMLHDALDALPTQR